MSTERRGHERKYITSEDVPGNFFIVVGEKSYEFFDVQDVSISGMGIVLKIDVPIGEHVGLRYVSRDLNIQLTGTVVWSETGEDGFRIGIQFDASDMNDNVMFFMTLREFLDDFDQNLGYG